MLKNLTYAGKAIEGSNFVTLQEGVYLSNTHNFEDVINYSSNFQIINKQEPLVDEFQRGNDRYILRYGVCDYVQQVLEQIPELLSKENHYIISLVSVKKSEQPSSLGWRWLAWGTYIGTQKPQEEYLFDEPEIEEVFCYHIYEVKKK